MAKGKGMGDMPGTHAMGMDQRDAANEGDREHADAWRKHNQGAAQKSYSAELGEALAPHAVEQGQRWPEAKGGKPNPGTEPDKRLKENRR